MAASPMRRGALGIMLSSPAPLQADRIGKADYRVISGFSNSIADVILVVLQGGAPVDRRFTGAVMFPA